MQWKQPNMFEVGNADDAWYFPQRFLSIKLSIKPAGVKGYSLNSTFPSTTTVLAWSMILRGYRPPSISGKARIWEGRMAHLFLPQYEISQLGQPFLGWRRKVRIECPRTRSIRHALAYLQLTEKLSHDFTAIPKDVLAVNLG